METDYALLKKWLCEFEKLSQMKQVDVFFELARIMPRWVFEELYNSYRVQVGDKLRFKDLVDNYGYTYIYVLDTNYQGFGNHYDIDLVDCSSNWYKDIKDTIVEIVEIGKYKGQYDELKVKIIDYYNDFAFKK